jgi:N-acetylglucosaminylphosphatidylinositol deacetylase
MSIDSTSSNQTSKKLKVLTVGDGDLTLSLALARAYGKKYLSLTASVLEASREKHQQAFPDAPLEELKERNVVVLYGVDAMQLHTSKLLLGVSTKWNLVSFHHPHLGQSTLMKGNEAEHAQKHHQLLCHYLFSASQVSDLVHVCLCGKQPQTWKLLEAAEKQNLILLKTLSTAVPFARIWTPGNSETIGTSSQEDDKNNNNYNVLPEAATVESGFSAPRRYWNGKLGSRHFLGKYGYRHRRTEGDMYGGTCQDIDVSSSAHFVFATSQNHADNNNSNRPTDPDCENKICPVCRHCFETTTALDDHLLAPAIPDFTRRKRIDHNKQQLKQLSVESSTKEARSEGPPDTSHCRQLMTATVSEDCHEKRLRWFLQHKTIEGLSKRRAGSMIHRGLVLVNGEGGLDDSRILKAGNQITILHEGSTECCSDTNSSYQSADCKIEVHYRSPFDDWIVVWKPSGIRTKGEFGGTLETLMSLQEHTRYCSLSSMETSCPGFCILSSLQSRVSMKRLNVRYYVTALVHGIVPEDWYPSKEFSINKEAKWRKKRKQSEKKMNEEEYSQPDNPLTQTVIKIIPMEVASMGEVNDMTFQDNQSTTFLTTVLVVTSYPSSGSLCQFFRTAGCPVVGDIFCKREFSTLKRAVRNRLKDKLCLGTYRVDVDSVGDPNPGKESETITVQKAIPEKLSAKHWEAFLAREVNPSLTESRTRLTNTTEKRRINVIVIAHPDDESMFFLPTIQSLKQKGGLIWLLCLTNGDYDGLGKIREKELLEVGEIMGLEKTIILDNPLLQDHPSQRWDKVVVASAIRTALKHHHALLPLSNESFEFVLYTFDTKGVSGHQNHIDTHLGVCHLMVQQRLNAQTCSGDASESLLVREAWQLFSERNAIVKYLPVISWMLLILSFVSENDPFVKILNQFEQSRPNDVVRVFRLHQPTLNWRAMATHRSQFVWYRRLFVVFSCYTYYNQMRLITRITSKDNKKWR